MQKQKNIFIAIFLITVLIFSSSAPVSAYGEISISGEVSLAETTVRDPDFLTWQSNWAVSGNTHTGDVILTPGDTPADLNFCWYAETPGTPAVLLSTSADFQNSHVVLGTGTPIDRTNGTISYTVSNKICVSGYFAENKTYYYRVTDDYFAAPINWSKSSTYQTGNSDNFQALIVSDVQIGASGSIDADTYNWNKTLAQAENTVSNPAFILSAGDQVNEKTTADTIQRECEYAGLLSPSLLRRVPFAAAIGNHDTKVSDYTEHFNNPNSEGNYGSTPAGCDYYFRYGNALFIVLNSNSRAASSHRKLMKQAVTEHGDATWRIVMMHHDIYGSGAMHSNRTSANLRTILAPLMDEFQIDLVFSGHDHSYSRSYSMLDGTAFVDMDAVQKNPLGTTYISLGTASGCKMYGLASPKQYYVAERSNDTVPAYSVLQVQKNRLTLQTYDYTGKNYADTLTLEKTKNKTNPLSFLTSIEKKKKSNYTTASFQKLQNKLNTFQRTFNRTTTDKGASKIETCYKKTNDPLSYYGYAAGTTQALPTGFSTLLDKTLYGSAATTTTHFTSSKAAVKEANTSLKKTSLTVKKGKKAIQNNQTVKLKKGKKLSLKVSKTPAKSKVTYSSAKKKYVTINKKGVITVKKYCKKPVKITVKFENRTLCFYVKTLKK